MKILLINYRYFISGGPERYMFNIIYELEKNGHEVIPFSTKNLKNHPSKYTDYFTTNIGGSDTAYFHEYKKTPKVFIDVIARQFYSNKVEKDLINLIKKTKPDICYLLHHINKLSPSVIHACKKMNVPVIHRLSDYFILCPQAHLLSNGKFCENCKTDPFSVVKQRCIRNSVTASLLKYLAYKFHSFLKIYDYISYFVCTNKFMYNQMIEFGYPKEKLVLNYTYFDKENFEKNSYDENLESDENRSVRFLYVGMFDPIKGCEDLLEAVKLLSNKQQMNNAVFDFVGGRTPSDMSYLEEIVEEYGLSDYVNIYESQEVDKLIQFYRDSDVSIFPSRIVENFPNVLLESLYFNLPVIVPDFGCFPGLVDETVSFKFKPYDVESLAKQISLIMDNPGIIKEKAVKTRPFILEKYSKDLHMKKLLELFDRVKKDN